MTTSSTTGSGGGGPTLGAYEAEDAFHAGTATFGSSLAGFSGTGYLDALAQANDRVVFAVHSALTGTANVSLRFANRGAVAKKTGIYVNGAKALDVDLDIANAFATRTDMLPLRAGLNTIAYVNDAATPGTVSLDRVDLANAAPRAIRGATRGFTEYEAEDGATNGTALGPDRAYGTIEAEASGRRAVKLGAQGQYVEWTMREAANALVVRYSMPDAPSGGGTEGTLSLYVNGVKKETLSLSSQYAWVYGLFPYSNDPSQGSPHRYFDDARMLVGDIAKGSIVRLQKDSGDVAPYYVVDLVDAERVDAPYARPADSLSITDYGAQGQGADDTAAIASAIAAAKAQARVLWIPQGEFRTTARFDVDHVTIRGAGPWYSVVLGTNGKGGFYGTGDEVRLFDFAMFGDVTYRDDVNFDAGIDGTLGKGSMLQNLWFEHTKVGIWVYAPTDGAYVVGCRIRDTFGDGLRLHGGTTNAAVDETHVRNTGDDGLAMHAESMATENNRFKFDSVELPMLGSGMGIYGGTSNRIEDSDVADTVTSSAGITVSSRFSPAPFQGTTYVERSTLTRTGGYEPNWMAPLGGLWIFADTSDITARVVVRDVDILESTYQGAFISFQREIRDALFERVTINGAGTYGIEIDAIGTATFNAVTVTGAASGGANIGSAFLVTRGTGNTGW